MNNDYIIITNYSAIKDKYYMHIHNKKTHIVVDFEITKEIYDCIDKYILVENNDEYDEKEICKNNINTIIDELENANDFINEILPLYCRAIKCLQDYIDIMRKDKNEQ